LEYLMKKTVEKIERNEFSQAIQLLKTFFDGNLNPYCACLVASSLPFVKLDQEQKQLVDWLKDYISPFMYSNPRNVGDLREKTLSILAYLSLEEKIGSADCLPNDLLFPYLLYADKEEWYSDSFIAFLAALVGEKNTVCQNAKHYFEKNISTFIATENIEAICQALFILPEIDSAKKIEGLQIVRLSLEHQSARVVDQMWGILALSTSDTDNDYKTMLETTEELYEHYRGLFASIMKESYSKNYSRKKREHTIGVHETEETKSESRSIAWQDEYHLTATDFFYEICLFIFTSLYSRTNTIIAFPGTYEDTAREFLLFSESKSKGFIQISKTANVIGNILTVLFTLLLLGCCIFYQAGLKLIDSKITSSEKISLGDWIVLLGILDYLISEIRAIIRKESALEGFKGIPILRQFKFKG